MLKVKNGQIKIDGATYSLLSQGENGQVIVLSPTEVGKIFELGATKKEAALMAQANSINSLVVKYLRVEITKNYSKEFLVMERLYPLQYRAFSVNKRQILFEVFEAQLKELHQCGWSHGDVKRPAWVKTNPWDNIILTLEGLRLIDTGSVITSDQDYGFEDWVKRDLRNIKEFREVFLEP